MKSQLTKLFAASSLAMAGLAQLPVDSTFACQAAPPELANQQQEPAQQPEDRPAIIRPVEPGGPMILPIEPLPPEKPVEPGPPTRIIEKPDAGQNDADQPQAEQWQKLNQGQIIMVATVTSTEMLMTTMSLPPRYALQFNVGKDAELLRGQIEGNIETIDFRYMTLDKDALPSVGDKLVLAVSTTKTTGGVMHVIDGLYNGDDDTIKLARQAVSLPVGWSINDEGKPVSPWASFGEKYPAELFTSAILDKMKRPTCAETDRPALALPEGIALTVEQVIPEDAKQYVNSYGDGKFKITLKNTTEKKLSIPALLAVENDSKMMLLDESLVVLHQGKPVFRPQKNWFSTVMQIMRLSSAPKPVEIEPGKTFSFEFNTLELQGIDWPRGGSRVQFTFALGGQAQTNFFYYFSRHHDKLLPEKSGTPEDADGEDEVTQPAEGEEETIIDTPIGD
jgi:hypothetical protein